MKCFALAILALMVACGGNPPRDTAPDEMKNPLATACQGGAVKSCLMAGDDAENRGDLDAAVSFYSRACDLGESNGCLLAGGLLIQRNETRQQGLELLESVCESGDPTGCYGAGLVLNGDLGGPSSPSDALAFFARACDAGLAAGCGKLGLLYLEGAGVEQDQNRGVSLIEGACQRGDGASCFQLARRASEAGQQNEAVSYYRNACLAGEGLGCTHLGFAYAEGEGVEMSPSSARDYFGQGCTAPSPDPRGCTMLGWSEWSGIGGETATREGKSRLEKACEVDGLACYYLARIARSQGELALTEKRIEDACALTPSMCEWFQQDIQGR